MSDLDWSVLPEGRWSDWRSTVDWSSIDKKVLLAYRHHLWYRPNPKTTPGVFSYVSMGEEKKVAFAIHIARSHHDLAVRDGQRRTLLQALIARRCSRRLVRLALKANPVCATMCDVNGENPYHTAGECESGVYVEELSRPIRARASQRPFYTAPCQALPAPSCNERNVEGWTPIHKAVERALATGNTGGMRALALHSRVDMNARRGADGYTVAHMCVRAYDASMVDICLSLGTDPRIRSEEGVTVTRMSRKCDTLLRVCARYVRKVSEGWWEEEPTPQESDDDDSYYHGYVDV